MGTRAVGVYQESKHYSSLPSLLGKNVSATNIRSFNEDHKLGNAMFAPIAEYKYSSEAYLEKIHQANRGDMQTRELNS